MGLHGTDNGKSLRAGTQGGELGGADFQTQHGCSTHQLTEAGVSGTRPVQDQANQNSSVDGQGFPGPWAYWRTHWQPSAAEEGYMAPGRLFTRQWLVSHPWAALIGLEAINNNKNKIKRGHEFGSEKSWGCWGRLREWWVHIINVLCINYMELSKKKKYYLKRCP